MFRADPLREVAAVCVVERPRLGFASVGDSDRARSVLRGVALGPHLEEHVRHVVRLKRDLAGENRRVVGMGLVRPPLRVLARELVAALLAQHDGERDERPALRTYLHERPRLAVRPRGFADIHGVDRPEALHVLPVVEDEA